MERREREKNTYRYSWWDAAGDLLMYGGDLFYYGFRLLLYLAQAAGEAVAAILELAFLAGL